MVKLKRFEERNVTPCPIETFIRALFDLKKNRAKRGEGGGEEKEWIFPRGESSPILLSETTLRCAFEASRACYYD